MHTDFFQRTVIRHFDQEGIKYTVTSENDVSVGLNTPEAFFRFRVHQPQEGLHILVVSVPIFVRFPPSRAAAASIMCKALNNTIVAKLDFDDDHDVSYFLEGKRDDNDKWGPDDVKVMLSHAMSSFVKIYPIVMTVRWANVTLEEATRMLEDG